MNTILERNKRKTLLGLLLFLLPRSRSMTVFVLLVVISAHFIFVSKALGLRMAWSKPTLSPASTNKRLAFDPMSVPYNRLLEAATDASARRGSSFNMESNRGILASYSQAVSSLRMVKSGFQDINGIARQPETAYHSHLPKAGKGTTGILNPDDAGRMEAGVPLEPEELAAGLRKNASADDGANSGPTATEGRASSPGNSLQPDGPQQLAGGKVSSYDQRQAEARKSDANPSTSGPVCFGKHCATHDLAEVLAYSCTAAPDGTSCAKSFANCSSGVCPGEFAARASGAPFYGATAADQKMLLTSNEPVLLSPNAQPLLKKQYELAEQQQGCESRIASGNPAVSAANNAFEGCCARVESGWQSCAAGCSGNANCIRSCNSQSNGSSQQCEQDYMNAYNSISGSQDAACNVKTNGKLVGMSPWNVPYHCVQH